MKILLTVLLVSATLAWAGEGIKTKKMLAIERDDTILSPEELVVVADGVGEGAPIIVVGDGVTTGGLTIGVPYTSRASTVSAIGRDMYTVIPYGNATYDVAAATWSLITPVNGSYSASNTGGVTIATIDGRKIYDITYETDVVTAEIASSHDGQEKLAQSVTLSATQNNAPMQAGILSRAFISNITVRVWDAPELYGITNDLRSSTLLVSPPETPDDALPLRDFLDRMSGRWGDDWAAHKAQSDVSLNWQSLRLNPYVALRTTTKLGTIAFTCAGRDIMRLDTAPEAHRIISFRASAAGLTLWVDAKSDFTVAPRLQRSPVGTNLWQDVESSTSWPRIDWHIGDDGQRYPAFSVTSLSPASGIYRIVGTAHPHPAASLYVDGNVNIATNAAYGVGTNQGITTNITLSGTTLHFVGGILVDVTN